MPPLRRVRFQLPLWLIPLTAGLVVLAPAVYGLWQVRDDCHMAAWRASALSGPEVEVLTRIWREEAGDEAALGDLLTHQRPEEVGAALVRLRRDGLVESNGLKTTSAGATARQRIEDETDRLFFMPWPDDVGARSGGIVHPTQCKWEHPMARPPPPGAAVLRD